MNSKPRSAFTLLELLIVVAIIAVLAGLVLVGVAMIKEQSRRIACGNNLRSWGLCAIAAATDNQGALLASYYEGMTSSVRPQLVAVNDSAWVRNHRYIGSINNTNIVHPIVREQFSIVKAAQYMDNSDRVLQSVADALGISVSVMIGINGNSGGSNNDGSYGLNSTAAFIDLPVGAFSSWRCPSQRAGFSVVPANDQGEHVKSRASSYISGMGYSYFARTDYWRFAYSKKYDEVAKKYTDEIVGGAPMKSIMMYTDKEPSITCDFSNNFDALKDANGIALGANADINGINAVCARTPQGDRILMSETLMYDGSSSQAELFGQSRLSGPNHIKTFGTIDKRGDLHAMTGNYVLMGDGRVSWRSKSTWDIAKMTAAQKNGWQTHYLGTVE